MILEDVPGNWNQEVQKADSREPCDPNYDFVLDILAPRRYLQDKRLKLSVYCLDNRYKLALGS